MAVSSFFSAWLRKSKTFASPFTVAPYALRAAARLPKNAIVCPISEEGIVTLGAGESIEDR